MPELRDAMRGDFMFRPGIDVTCVEEVKGLEFAYVGKASVILPESITKG